MSIRSSLSIIFLALLANVGGALVIVKFAINNQKAIGAAEARRYESYRLADELRQTSDDLTKMARLFVVTGEARFRDYFELIRDIRDGIIPRPVDYHKIYWDFVSSSGRKPRASGHPVALEEMMRAMQFTDEDFELLRRSKSRSDNLIRIEERAMNAAVGLYLGPDGEYTVPGEPDSKLARSLMHSDKYLRAKGVIMEPLEVFFERIEERTASEVGRLRKRAHRLNIVVLSIMSVAVVLLLVSFLIVQRKDFSAQSSHGGAAAEEGEGLSLSVILTVWPLVVAAIVICIAITSVAWSIGRQLEDRVRIQTGYTLSAVMQSSMRSVENWLNRSVADARLLADLPVVRAWVNSRISRRWEPNNSTLLPPEEVSSVLNSLISGGGYEGYMVLSRDGHVIVDSDGHDYGNGGVGAALSHKLYQGVLLPPDYTYLSLPHWTGGEIADPDLLASQIVVTAGVRDEAGEVNAMLAFRLSPSGEFSTILQRGRIGDTGESFSFNRSGRLISQLRFDDRLRRIGVLSEDAASILSIEIRDPGGDLESGFAAQKEKAQWPYTTMARRAIAGNSGVDLDGYNDVRGVPVIGAWDWNETFGFGVATEVEVDEIFETLHWYQKQAVTGTAVAVILILGLTAIFIRNRIRMAAVNARLNEAYGVIKKHSERMEEELNIGREIQMSMIPLTFPAFPDRNELSVFAALEPAREVGGDFYDFFFIDDDRICLCVGDVSGKGVPAALFMAVTKTLITSRALDDRSPASIITHVNDALSQDNKACMFVTLFLGIVNVASGEFVYTNAGHNRPYIRRSNGETEQVPDVHGPVVGPVEGMVYEESIGSLSEGDLLLIFTDGVSEAMNADGELFTDERIVDSLVCEGTGSAREMVTEVITHVREFVRGTDQSDDITLLALHYHGRLADGEHSGIRLSISNQVKQIQPVQRRMDEVLKTAGVSEEVNRELNIVVDELLTNIIKHGYGKDEHNEIEFRMEFSGDRVRITFIDDGVPFNPLGTRAPFMRAGIDERQIGGLGIHLVRNLVDDIGYRRRTGKNVLTLYKIFR